MKGIKMKITKPALITGAVTAVTAGSLLSVGFASAHPLKRDGKLSDRIATTFNLDKEKVQNTVDKFRQEKRAKFRAEIKAKRQERLQNLVDNGTITADQKTALEQKSQDRLDMMKKLKGQSLTKEQIHKKVENMRNDFKTWAKKQGINLQDIRPDRDSGRNHMKSMGRFGHIGMDDHRPESPGNTDTH